MDESKQKLQLSFVTTNTLNLNFVTTNTLNLNTLSYTTNTLSVRFVTANTLNNEHLQASKGNILLIIWWYIPQNVWFWRPPALFEYLATFSCWEQTRQNWTDWTVEDKTGITDRKVPFQKHSSTQRQVHIKRCNKITRTQHKLRRPKERKSIIPFLKEACWIRSLIRLRNAKKNLLKNMKNKNDSKYIHKLLNWGFSSQWVRFFRLTHRVIPDRVHRLLVTLSYFRPDRFVQFLSLIPILILLLYLLVSVSLNRSRVYWFIASRSLGEATMF